MPHEETRARTSSLHTREIGHELRTVRRRSKTKGTTVCAELGWSPAKLSKMESGLRRPSWWDAARLLGLCGASPEADVTLRGLMGESDSGCFVRRHGDLPPDAVAAVVMHEDMATAITTYAPTLIPRLAQSADYARDLLGDVLDDAAALEAAVEARIARRDRLLCGPHVPRVLLYLGEAALSSAVGGSSVMRDQLTALALMVGSGVLAVRVVPAHVTPGQGGTRLELPGLPPVVYHEIDRVTVVYDDADLVARWLRREDGLDRRALSVSESLDVLWGWVDVHDRASLDSDCSRGRVAGGAVGVASVRP